jgi:hypothetical protein
VSAVPTDRPGAPLGAVLSIDPAALAPLVKQIVEATLAAAAEAGGQLPDRIAFGESEAARMLGLRAHQLRDERLRGRSAASVGPGRRILYSRQDLVNYLAERRWEGGEPK